jgi:UDP-GlcNAc:undecaprenyl-phosphate GlcNAc-1-phosphate transferase
MDRPDHRRVNVSPVPRGGGLAIATTFVAVVVAVTLANEWLRVIPMPESIGWAELTALLGGGAAAALIGAADDYYQLRARWQFLGQLALALVAIVIGISVDFVANPFGPGLLFLRDFAGAFTVFWSTASTGSTASMGSRPGSD